MTSPEPEISARLSARQKQGMADDKGKRFAEESFDRYEGVKMAAPAGKKRFSRFSDAPAGEWKTWKETLSMLDKPPKGWYNYLCCISTRSAVG